MIKNNFLTQLDSTSKVFIEQALEVGKFEDFGRSCQGANGGSRQCRIK